MNDKWEPFVCMMTNSTCYKNTSKMQIKGILWHDTGCDNVWLSRYVQPTDGAPDAAAAIAKIGKNRYGNDWNHIEKQAGLNFWIGKFADGTVGTVQTMPWDYRPWGCGSGPNGSCNSGWIQFEICEDAKNDKDYAQKCWDEAIAATAYLCKKFNIDPYGTATCNGVTVPTIICHWDSYKLGLGSGHGDIYDWFPKILGKDMDDVRKEVAEQLKPHDGWTEEDGKWYYYKDGKKAIGWQIIDKKFYYFDSYGVMQTGWVTIDNKKYYFETDGTVKKGLLRYNKHWYYLDPKTGIMATGWQKVNDFMYYMHPDGIIAQNEWIKSDKDYFWLSKDGKWKYKYKGSWHSIGEEDKDKKWWFRDENGWVAKDKTIIIDRAYCTFDEQGILTKKCPINPVDTNFKIKVTADVLNVRSGPSVNYDITTTIAKGGVYTIVEVKDNWGRLKSGAGWICLDYTEKVN